MKKTLLMIALTSMMLLGMRDASAEQLYIHSEKATNSEYKECLLNKKDIATSCNRVLTLTVGQGSSIICMSKDSVEETVCLVPDINSASTDEDGNTTYKLSVYIFNDSNTRTKVSN